MASNYNSQSGADSTTTANAARPTSQYGQISSGQQATLDGTCNLSQQTVSGGYPGHFPQVAPNGVGIAVPGQPTSLRTPFRHPITLATAMAHRSSNQHTLTRLKAENAQLRSNYHRLINTVMQKHPELGSPPVPDWCTVVSCKEEGRILESQVEDISRLGPVGLDVTAEVFDRLRRDYASLLVAHRNVLREQAILNDDIKRLTRQSGTFTGSPRHPFLHCTEDTDKTPIIGLDDIIRAAHDNGPTSTHQQQSQNTTATAIAQSSGSATKRHLSEEGPLNGPSDVPPTEKHISKRRKHDQA